MKIVFKILTFLIIVSLNLIAEGLDDLLLNIEKKTDLSQKTKMENGGISFIYTREDLERMQVKSLKDILKLTYPFGYDENRYSLADPLSMGGTQAFMSSVMRIFIDNQEITTSLYGSGLIVLGDIDMGFVNHVEIYSRNPSYEFSTEPTSLLIKLYSKKADKDAGGKIELNGGSYGFNRDSAYHSQEMEDWSYFAYFSSTNEKRKKYESHGEELSRDKKVKHIFGTFYNENQKILIQGINREGDSFIDRSLDATAQKNTIDMDFLHLGYDLKMGHFKFLLTYDLFNSQTAFLDDVAPLEMFNYFYPIASVNSDTKSAIYTGEVKHNYKSSKNQLIVGAKYRFKDFKYEVLNINGAELPPTGNTNQIISTVFAENQYSWQDNSIFSTGIQYANIRNNDSIQQDKLFMYRLGHTFTTKYWVFKTLHSHTKTSLDPYLINSYGHYIADGRKNPQIFDSILENIIYQKDSSKYEVVLDYIRTKNFLIPNETGLLENLENDIFLKGFRFAWTKNYNRYDKLFLSFGYMEIKNIPNIEKEKKIIVILRNLNSYKKFDFFNELLYSKDNIYKNDSYDYSAGVKYHYTKDLIFSLKGENILNKAKPTIYRRVNPVTFQPQESLEISPIDKKFMLSLEYLF